MEHRDLETLKASLAALGPSPRDEGEVLMITCRPAKGERRVLGSAELSPGGGLAGDSWKSRGSSRTHDGSADPETQVTLMNSRVIEALAGSRDRWSLAGDQFFVDLDLSKENLPPGTRLAVGSAEIEITAKPHTGCAKFRDWFGPDSLILVNSPEGLAGGYRGINARVIKSGKVKTGDKIRKLPSSR